MSRVSRCVEGERNGVCVGPDLPCQAFVTVGAPLQWLYVPCIPQNEGSLRGGLQVPFRTPQESLPSRCVTLSVFLQSPGWDRQTLSPRSYGQTFPFLCYVGQYNNIKLPLAVSCHETSPMPCKTIPASSQKNVNTNLWRKKNVNLSGEE